MRIKFYISFKVVALLFAILFTTNSCSDIFDNPMKDKETGDDLTLLIIDPNVFDTKITVHLVDTVGNNMDGIEVFVAFAGEKASNIVSTKGEKHEYFSTKDGALEVGIDPNIDISATNPFAFTVLVALKDRSWYAFPKDVELIQKGNVDIIVEMIPFNMVEMNASNEFKSANLSPLAPGNEPFNIKFADQLISSSNGWAISNLGSTYYSGKAQYYSYFYPTATKNGKLTSTDLSIDPKLIDNYGIIVSYSGIKLWRGINFENEQAINYTVYTGPYRFVSLFGDNYYSGITRKNITKCEGGINIQVEEKYGQTGTAKFNYTLSIKKRDYSASDDSYRTEKVLEGKIGSSSMPYTVNTGTFYYPNNLSDALAAIFYDKYDENKLTLTLTGDGQYDLEPSQFEISNFCGQTYTVKAVPKSGLKPYKIIASFSCINNPVGVAPTISGKYREQGTTEPWTYFNFSGGSAILQLKPGKSYSIEGNLSGQTGKFDFPTDPAKVGAVLAQAKKEIEELETINYKFTEQTTGAFIGTQIKIDVVFKDGECPY